MTHTLTKEAFQQLNYTACALYTHSLTSDAEEVYVDEVTQELMFNAPLCIAAHLPQGLQHLQESVSHMYISAFALVL